MQYCLQQVLVNFSEKISSLVCMCVYVHKKRGHFVGRFRVTVILAKNHKINNSYLVSVLDCV